MALPDGRNVPAPRLEKRILPDHLEDGSLSLVVFGPGKGEACVLILPDGTVGVVDGCREPSRPGTGEGDPVREFLDALAVRRGGLELGFVALTHPHDDHYAGLGRLLTAFQDKVDAVWRAPQVGTHFAQPLLDFAKVTRGGRALSRIFGQNVKGLLRVLATMRESRQPGRSRRARLSNIEEGKLLLRRSVPGRGTVEIHGCGPADGDADTAHHALVAQLRRLQGRAEAPVSVDPNFISGALLVQWEQAGILLGGDLLGEKGDFQGWHGVAEHIHGPVQVIKVAHHASAEAHHEELWNRLGAHLAIVTPFKNAAGAQPPRPEQITLLAQKAVVAITAPPHWHGKNAAYPSRHYSPLPTRHSRMPRARNTSVPHHATLGARDIRNAVAVSLDANGQIRRFVLAGEADVYEPPTAAAVPSRSRP
jgi:beta-lactamase superfamily II metal-dependent hydrolase